MVHSRDAFWEMKQQKLNNPNAVVKPKIVDVHMPKNTGTGFVIAMFSGVFGFALIWHMYAFVIVGLLGIMATVVVRTFRTDIDYYLTAPEIEKFEQEILNKA